ncbi:DUF3786 domain-containing protein [Candidatus Omnitrophota bacterium]
MGYETSLKKAWDAFQESGKDKECIRFFNDDYEVDFLKKKVLSQSSNAEAKDYHKILILHYIANETKALSTERDDLISFKEMGGGEVYFPAFRKRAIGPILKKYGDGPGAIFKRADFLNAERVDTGSAAISIKIFPKIKAQIILWAKDDEFDADCNMLFNRSTKKILPTEDVAVLGGIIASLLT